MLSSNLERVGAALSAKRRDLETVTEILQQKIQLQQQQAQQLKQQQLEQIIS